MLPLARTTLALTALGTLTACGGAGLATMPTPTPPVTPVSAAMVNATPALAFTPVEVHLLQGGTVTFAFGSVGHNVYFDDDPDGAPDNIPGVNSNATVTRVFTKPGTYPYDCHIHPGMQGTVIVVASD
jgi:plastocyanin